MMSFFFLCAAQIQDNPGNDEVVLTRTFGNEKFVFFLCGASCRRDFEIFFIRLRLMFSIADIDSMEEDFQSEEEESEDQEDEGDDPLHTYPIRASLSITKVYPIIYDPLNNEAPLFLFLDNRPRLSQCRHGRSGGPFRRGKCFVLPGCQTWH